MERDLKQLKIKANSLKRTLKGYEMNFVEVKTEEDRLQKFIDEKKDESHLKQQRQVVEEAKSMIPYTKGKVVGFYRELKNIVEKKLAGKEEELAENEDYQNAKKYLEEAEEIVKKKKKKKAKK